MGYNPGTVPAWRPWGRQAFFGPAGLEKKCPGSGSNSRGVPRAMGNTPLGC